jgi:hypothetical protein
VKICAVKATLGVSNVSDVISTVFVRVGGFDKEYVHTNAQSNYVENWGIENRNLVQGVNELLPIPSAHTPVQH